MSGEDSTRDAEDTEALLSACLALADALHDLDAILPGLAALLSTRFPVSRISVRTYDPDGDVLLIVAVWSTTPTEVRAGTRLPVRSTSFREVERKGAAVMSVWQGEDGTPLLDRVIHDEGNESWVVIPLWRDGVLAGLLTISAGKRDALDRSDLPFFEALGAVLGERLLRLACSPL